jgi:hypothetical protein
MPRSTQQRVDTLAGDVHYVGDVLPRMTDRVGKMEHHPLLHREVEEGGLWTRPVMIGTMPGTLVMSQSRTDLGEALLPARIGQAHNRNGDGNIPANCPTPSPHLEHRIVDQFFDEMGIGRQMPKEIGESHEIQRVQLIYRGAIASGYTDEEGALGGLSGLLPYGRSRHRIASQQSEFRHGELLGRGSSYGFGSCALSVLWMSGGRRSQSGRVDEPTIARLSFESASVLSQCQTALEALPMKSRFRRKCPWRQCALGRRTAPQ